MQEQKELTLLSDISILSIKNYPGEVEVTLLPHLRAMMDVAHNFQPSSALPPHIIETARVIS
ncbi:MAG: hypothetical protein K2X50_01400 [Gammaproteobacteria bacterium]|nr:hypothetical protein [Gammaproteobacteria bacterium]